MVSHLRLALLSRWSFVLVAPISLAACSAVDDDDEPAPTCADLTEPGATWEIDDGEDGQIHPRTALADGLLWSAWNRPDGSNEFAVFAGARSCDGEVVVPPTRLDDGSGNATDPDLAVSGGRVLVAWQTDDGGTPYNLSVRTALLDRDGLARGDERIVMLDGEPSFEGQAWMAHLAGIDGGWALALIRAGEGDLFHPALQWLDEDGAVDGSPVPMMQGEPAPEGYEPAISARDGEVHVAWARAFDGLRPYGMEEITAGSDQSEPVPWGLLDLVGPSVALTHDGSGALWGAVSVGATRVDLGKLGGAQVTVVSGGGVAARPGLAGRSSGGVIAWSEGSQSSASLMAQSFDGDGELIGDAMEVVSGVGAYPPDVVALSDELVALTFAEGQSPNYRLRTEVIALP